jgi:hypothetical protein
VRYWLALLFPLFSRLPPRGRSRWKVIRVCAVLPSTLINACWVACTAVPVPRKEGVSRVGRPPADTGSTPAGLQHLRLGWPTLLTDRPMAQITR